MAEGGPGRSRSLGGCALIVVGLLVLVPSGLCTGFFAISTLVMGLVRWNGNGIVVTLVIALIIGLPFIAIGTVLLRVGIRVRRRK